MGTVFAPSGKESNGGASCPDYGKIHEFAVKYLKLYSEPDCKEEDVAKGFGEECFGLGLEMDCAKAFSDAYGIAAFYHSADLKELIDEINDPIILGSGIFKTGRTDRKTEAMIGIMQGRR